MTKQERELILSFILGKTSESEFIASFGHDFRTHPQDAVDLLEKARQEQSPDDVELSLMLIDKYHCLPGTLPILNQLLAEGWHWKHEDIALALEKLHAPSSVESLYQAALSSYRYLDYDESYELARKCIWALSKIGTVEADRRLRDLSQGENSVIAQYARQRLSATSSGAA